MLWTIMHHPFSRRVLLEGIFMKKTQNIPTSIWRGAAVNAGANPAHFARPLAVTNQAQVNIKKPFLSD
jgi:hypothetical protein